jgi:hypothetical protein
MIRTHCKPVTQIISTFSVSRTPAEIIYTLKEVKINPESIDLIKPSEPGEDLKKYLQNRDRFSMQIADIVTRNNDRLRIVYGYDVDQILNQFESKQGEPK